MALVLLFSAIGLSADARGPKHHHGDEIGTHGTNPAAQTGS